ncbi:MAG: mechanosensitive ion channel family protein [Candidatus Diapherotrites archaeon]|nr:mechanosensitive ion channel family protein [Candidatus Diapherotrites archaeon]
MDRLEEKKKFAKGFWIAFFILAAFLLFYYSGVAKAFNRDLDAFLGAYDWIFDSLLLFLFAMFISRIVTGFLKRQFRRIGQAKHLKLDRTRLAISESLATATIYIIAFIIIVESTPELKAYSTSVLAGVGFLAIVVGFAAQETISNVVAGILIAIYQPFRVGDRIEFQGKLGKVEDISLRHTVIRNWENKMLVVPNALISKETITNYTLGGDEKLQMSIEVPLGNDANIDKARKIMLEELKKHRNFFQPKDKGAPEALLTEFRESGFVLSLFFWAKDFPTGFAMSCDLRESIKKRLDREGISMLLPQRMIVQREGTKK